MFGISEFNDKYYERLGVRRNYAPFLTLLTGEDSPHYPTPADFFYMCPQPVDERD